MSRALWPSLAAASAALAVALVVLSMLMRGAAAEAAMSLAFLLALVTTSLSLLAMASQRRPTAHRGPNVVTVISCMGCGYREEREFKAGDFVFKRLGSCTKCGGELFISAIYAIAQAKERA